MYRINLENISLEKVEPQELLDIKINTLETYAEVSHARNLAFNYFPQTEAFELDEGRLWDTDNVSWLGEKDQLSDRNPGFYEKVSLLYQKRGNHL
jgi:hypothetical protein